MFKITKPQFIINKDTVRKNIKRMVSSIREQGAVPRPHFKTHQSAEIGEMFRDEGVDKITVSSVTMAEYFFNHGWRDICIAFLFNPPEADVIEKLSRKCSLSLTVDSADSARCLTKLIKRPAGVWLKIDTGYRRTGLKSSNTEEISECADIIHKSKNLSLKGILTHCGNTYSAESMDEIKKIREDAGRDLKNIKDTLVQKGFTDILISYGDTPSCSIDPVFRDFDEIRCGNFVFYDLMQYRLTACKAKDIACAVAAPVVGIYPERNEAVVYCGAVHLSKEFIMNENSEKCFGLPCYSSGRGWSEPIQDAFLCSLSQEHGIIRFREIPQNLKTGDLLFILPVHSCLSADLFPFHVSTEGDIISRSEK